MLLNEVLFPRKRSPFPKRGRHSLSPSERVIHSAERVPPSHSGKVSAHPTKEVSAFPFGEGGGTAAERGPPPPFGEGGGAADGRGQPSPLGKVAAQPTEEVSFPLWGEWRAAPREVRLPFYFYFNSATIATIIETIEVNAANSPNI